MSQSPYERRMDSLQSIEGQEIKFLENDLFTEGKAVKLATDNPSIGYVFKWSFVHFLAHHWSTSRTYFKMKDSVGEVQEYYIDHPIINKEHCQALVKDGNADPLEWAWKLNMLSYKRQSRGEGIRAIIGLIEEAYNRIAKRVGSFTGRREGP